MNIKSVLYRVSLLLTAVCILSCKDDEEMASIEGKWQGTKMEIKVTPTGSPIPYQETDEDFNPILEFKADGIVTLVYDSQTSSGTYKVEDKKLITTITFNTSFLELSGTYTIETLTNSSLTFFIEKTDDVTLPNVGNVSGTVKATLYFSKM